jgi:hypothetical protein
MWEWFLPSDERAGYYSQIMEGPHGGGGPLEPKVVGWMWGFCIGGVVGAVVVGAFWLTHW